MENKLHVLIACEESQVECAAFRRYGHLAFSCDIQACKPGARSDWHIHGDVTPYLRGKNVFRLSDGNPGRVPRWDLIIAHPPCTYLSKVSSVWMVVNGELQMERYRKMIMAREFFFKCLNANATFVAVENPLPMARACLPPPDCYAQPYWFGSRWSKKTCYWLKNLPPLMPEIINPNHKQLVRCTRGKYRSRTDAFLADAIARQWGDYVTNTLF